MVIMRSMRNSIWKLVNSGQFLVRRSAEMSARGWGFSGCDTDPLVDRLRAMRFIEFLDRGDFHLAGRGLAQGKGEGEFECLGEAEPGSEP